MRVFASPSPAVSERPSGLAQSAGNSLPSATRSFFDSRFGHDFSGVRVHADQQAAALTGGLNARALTVGNDIAFAAGEYAPGTTKGRQLLAHELAHVVQQGNAPRFQSLPRVSARNDPAEREADVAAETVMRGGAPPALGPPGALVQRACGQPALGTPQAACQPSTSSAVGWAFQFQTGCDDLVAGEESNITRIRHHNRLNIHGYASSADGPASFLGALSCHRANKLAELARTRRPDCRIDGTFAHGASQAGLGSVGMIEQTRDTGLWLDPSGNLAQIRAQLNHIRSQPSPSGLDALAARRAQIRTWLNDIPTSVAPVGSGIQMDRTDLENYRLFYASAEGTWRGIDALLVAEGHSAAAQDTYAGWAVGPGQDQGSRIHIQQPLPTAFIHIDIFGEGYFRDAFNIGMATRTSTTGINDSRVPNVIHRRFSGDAARNRLPIADHTADLVTAENGPIFMAGLAAEIARIIAPGGTIILNNPATEERHHDAVAAAVVGGVVTKTRRQSGSILILETRIVAPAGP